MKYPAALPVLLPLLVSLAGCASSGTSFEAGEQRYAEAKAAGFSEGDALNISQGRVWLGMSGEALRLSWGAPYRVHASNSPYGRSETWIWPGFIGTFDHPRRAELHNGALAWYHEDLTR